MYFVVVQDKSKQHIEDDLFNQVFLISIFYLRGSLFKNIVSMGLIYNWKYKTPQELKGDTIINSINNKIIADSGTNITQHKSKLGDDCDHLHYMSPLTMGHHDSTGS